MAGHLRVAVDRAHSAQERRLAVVQLLREHADKVESGEIQADEAILMLSDFQDPDTFMTYNTWTCRPFQAMGMIRLLQRELDREMGID